MKSIDRLSIINNGLVVEGKEITGNVIIYVNQKEHYQEIKHLCAIIKLYCTLLKLIKENERRTCQKEAG